MTHQQPLVNNKQAIDTLIAEQRHAEALATLRAFYFAAPTLASAAFVLARMPQLSHLLPSRVHSRLAVLRSFTIEPTLTLLKAYAALYGVELEAKVGEFNTYAQELLSPSSFLKDFEPNILLVAVQTRDLLPELWANTSVLGSDSNFEQLCDRALADFKSYIQTYRSGGGAASIVIQTMEMPGWAADGILAGQPQAAGGSAASMVARFNTGLGDIAKEISGVYLLDYDALIARHGREQWHDEQKWLSMRMPVSAECLPHLAVEYLRFVLPLAGKVCKALVCDLDNTLWGGVIGEDGMSGIKLDADQYPGTAFRNLQQAALNLTRRGVLLAAASKNNPADALQAIDEHPGMLLRSKDFSATRINWSDKAQNLREIAKELNIGIDALAFLDDNPVERRRVQTELPEVCVIDLPADNPMLYAAALQSCPALERLTLSNEDQQRGQMYSEQRLRAELASASGTLEEFYRSLEQQLEITVVEEYSPSLARAAQLTQKTNQFNTTTLRCSEQEMAAFAADPNCEVLAVRVADRFGDNGIVGVAMLRYSETDTELNCEIVDLLMSCRVIGRKVETAILAQILERAGQKPSRAEKKRVWGWFLPTAKNAPAADFFREHGFTTFEPAAESDGDGRSAWEYSLDGEILQTPEFIHVAVVAPMIQAAPNEFMAAA